MRRNRKPWQEKLGSYALEYLEAYKQTRSVFDLPIGGLAQVTRFMKEQRGKMSEARKRFPKPPGKSSIQTVRLDKSFIRLMEREKLFQGLGLKVGENETEAFMAELLRISQKLSRFFEKKPEHRALVYFSLPLAYMILRPLVDDLRNRHFGSGPLDERKTRLLAAMCLEMTANLLRGRLIRRKGRINRELIHILNLVQEHQEEPLTDRDLQEAVSYAGIDVPTEQHSWSVWLGRARKEGFIGKAKKKPTA